MTLNHICDLPRYEIKINMWFKMRFKDICELSRYEIQYDV